MRLTLHKSMELIARGCFGGIKVLKQINGRKVHQIQLDIAIWMQFPAYEVPNHQ